MTPTTLEVATLATILLRQSKARGRPAPAPATTAANPHGLPDGRPIARLMAKTFRAMEKQVLASPTTAPDLARFIRPLAKELARLTLPYRAESGRSMLDRLGLPTDWTPDRKANDDRARFAAKSIVATTEDEVRAALDGLAEPEGKATVGIPASPGFFARAVDAIRSVFRRAFRDRAPAIAEVEASEAVHAAAVEAVRVHASALATKPMKTWLTDGEPCKAICIPNSLAGPVALGEPFPSGDKWPPAHPNCRCSISIEDVPVSPATAR